MTDRRSHLRVVEAKVGRATPTVTRSQARAADLVALLCLVAAVAVVAVLVSESM